MRKRLARYFTAEPYQYENGEVIPCFETLAVLHDGAAPSCMGHCGDVKLDSGWHALWGFKTRRKAKRFLGRHDQLLAMREINALMQQGRYTQCAHYLTKDDPPEQIA